MGSCPLEHKGAHGLGHHDLGDEDLAPHAGAVDDSGLDGVGEDFGHHHSRPIGDALGDVAEGSDGGPHLEPDDMGRQATLLDAGEILLWVCIVPLVSLISDSVDGDKQMLLSVDEGVQQVVIDPSGSVILGDQHRCALEEVELYIQVNCCSWFVGLYRGDLAVMDHRGWRCRAASPVGML